MSEEYHGLKDYYPDDYEEYGPMAYLLFLLIIPVVVVADIADDLINWIKKLWKN